jgi:hypothetical protein
MDIASLESFYGKIIAVQGEIYWTNNYIVLSNKNVITAVLRNPPEQFLIKEIIKDIPGQQSFLD